MRDETPRGKRRGDPTRLNSDKVHLVAECQQTSEFSSGSHRRMRISFDVTAVGSHPDTNSECDEDTRSKAAVDEEESKLNNFGGLERTEGKLKTEKLHYISHHLLDSCHLDHSELAEHLQKCASRRQGQGRHRMPSSLR